MMWKHGVGFLFIGLIFCSFSSGIFAKNTIGNSDKAFFIALGPNFGPSIFFMQFQPGLQFSLLRDGGFELMAGPQLNICAGTGFIMDLDGFFKINYHFDKAHSSSFSLHGKIPLGYSFAVPAGSLPAFHNGINFGILPGITYHLNSRLSFFGEIGYLHRVLWSAHKETSNLPSASITLGMSVGF